MENRRKTRRKLLVSEIEIFSPDVRKSLGKGFITNLTEDGLGFLATGDLSPGKELLLNFNLPNGWKFDVFGTVVYAEKGIASTAYGVRFSPGQGTFIFKLVS